MNDPKTNYIVSAAPHLKASDSTESIMRNVCLALLPAFLVGFYVFGWYAMLITLLSIATCLVTEVICQKMRGIDVTISDYSAVVSGLLLAAVLPPNVSWWVPIVGGVFAMGVVKQAFGGLGSNIWNPALAARAFLQVSIPTQINSPSWPMINEKSGGLLERLGVTMDGSFGDYIKSTADAVKYGREQAVDAVSQATHLAGDKLIEAVNSGANNGIDVISQATPLTKLMTLSADQAAVAKGITAQQILPDYSTIVWNSFLGLEPGCIAEVSALALILGGLFLLYKKIITWEAPAFFILTVALLTWVLPSQIYIPGGATGYTEWFSGPVLLHLFGGGLMIGAFFMDTDYVTTPMTRKGKIIFAIGCGIITAMIRMYSSSYPEGCCYSILIMNTCVPLIDAWTKPRVFGTKKSHA